MPPADDHIEPALEPPPPSHTTLNLILTSAWMLGLDCWDTYTIYATEHHREIELSW